MPLILTALIGCQSTQPVNESAPNGESTEIAVKNKSSDRAENRKTAEKLSSSVAGILSPGTYCYQLRSQEVNTWQSEAATPAAGWTAGANNVKTKQVKFGAGQRGTTVSGALIRGDRDVYQLNCSKWSNNGSVNLIFRR